MENKNDKTSFKDKGGQLIPTAYEMICEDFAFFPDTGVTNGESTEERQQQLRNWLADKVNLMMQQDMERLFQALYRLDVSEQKVKAALANLEGEPAHFALADLIIERELRKLRSRAWYRERLEKEKAEAATETPNWEPFSEEEDELSDW